MGRTLLLHPCLIPDVDEVADVRRAAMQRSESVSVLAGWHSRPAFIKPLVGGQQASGLILAAGLRAPWGRAHYWQRYPTHRPDVQSAAP